MRDFFKLESPTHNVHVFILDPAMLSLQWPKLGASSTDEIHKVRTVPEFCEKVFHKCSMTYLRSRPLIVSIWELLGKLFENIPDKVWPSANTLENMTVRLDLANTIFA